MTAKLNDGGADDAAIATAPRNRKSDLIMTLWKYAGTASLMLGLCTLALPAAAQVTPPLPDARPAAFAQCLACHTITPGKNGFGPSLAGIAGRKAASLPGYAYSEALKKSGISWNAATLDRWLTSPQKMVPGTRMPFAGIADPARRKQLVDYLLTLK